MVLDAQESYNCGKLEYCTTAVVESRRGFLRIAVTLAREGLAARFSESPHQVHIILRGSCFYFLWVFACIFPLDSSKYLRAPAGFDKTISSSQKYHQAGERFLLHALDPLFLSANAQPPLLDHAAVLLGHHIISESRL